MSLDLFMNEVRKPHKYRWHDLRENPEDLPEKDGWYIVCKERLDDRNYKFVTVCGYDAATKSFDCGSRWAVKAWREVEPFEEEAE